MNEHTRGKLTPLGSLDGQHWVVLLSPGGALGRMTTRAPLGPVPIPFASTYETRADAALAALSAGVQLVHSEIELLDEHEATS